MITETQDNNGSMDNPLTDFSNCHEGIIKNFESLRALAQKDIPDPVPADIKKLAKQLLTFFQDVVLEHHKEEEQELFAEVKDSARAGGTDATRALEMIEKLTAEHRSLEEQWQALEPSIKKLAKGKPVILDQAAALKLAKEYLAHAHLEEQAFLPLSEKILGERGLSSLGLSLHMRHNQIHLPTYI